MRGNGGDGEPDIAWYTPAGTRMSDNDWRVGYARTLAVFLNGDGGSGREAGPSGPWSGKPGPSGPRAGPVGARRQLPRPVQRQPRRDGLHARARAARRHVAGGARQRPRGHVPTSRSTRGRPSALPAFRWCCFVGWRAVPPRSVDQPRVLFATAELSPIARVGGLAEAAAGLTAALAQAGVDVDVVLPDYDNRRLDDEVVEDLDVPAVGRWSPRPARHRRQRSDRHARRRADASLALIRISIPSTGEGWIDNDHRFAAFCAAVAALTKHAPARRLASQRLAHRRSSSGCSTPRHPRC